MRYSTLTTPIGELVLTADPDGALTGRTSPTTRRTPTAGSATTRCSSPPAASSPSTSPASGPSSTSRCAPRARRSRCRSGTALLRIPYGETASYGEIAREIGHPTASRAVGAANGRNPIAIIVPCHRVIGSSGSLTGYGGGLECKRALLDLEAGRAALV